MSLLFEATILILLVFIASMISVELAISAAIVEIIMGITAANVLHLHSAPWMDFIAGFGGILLTFLAGIEVDPQLLRQKCKQSILIGFCSFLLPYLAGLSYCYYIAHWSWDASLIAACSMSSTSLAVVYAVLVEMNLANTTIGKTLMASTFITCMCMAIAMSLSFTQWDIHTLFSVIISVVLIVTVPRYLPRFFARYKDKVIEPEIKFLFFLLFLFMALGQWGKIHAVLPVFILGLCMANLFKQHKDLHRKLRIGAFAMITPFFFIKSGMGVSITALLANWSIILTLFCIKIGFKFAGVYPLARRYTTRHAPYFTLLMTTGLTFGNIAASFGLQEKYITPTQFSILIGVIILAAIIPTFIAQHWFSPDLSEETKEELMAQEEESA